MSKKIYEEAKRDLISLTAKFVIPSVEETDYGCLYDSVHFYNTLDEQEEKYYKTVEHALEQAQKQEKLLKLYEKLADHRLRVIQKLLDEIDDSSYFDGYFDDSMVEVEKYGDEDKKIVKEIAKIKELENE